MAARNHAIEKYIAEHPGTSEFDAMSKLVCYVSNQVRFRRLLHIFSFVVLTLAPYSGS